MQENSEIFAVFLAYCICRKQTKKEEEKTLKKSPLTGGKSYG